MTAKDGSCFDITVHNYPGTCTQEAGRHAEVVLSEKEAWRIPFSLPKLRRHWPRREWHSVALDTGASRQQFFGLRFNI